MPDSERAHETVFEFAYDDACHARLVERSVRQEAGEISDDRTTARVDRDGRTLQIRVEARDLVGLRAGMNTWLSLVEVAERAVAAPP